MPAVVNILFAESIFTVLFVSSEPEKLPFPGLLKKLKLLHMLTP